MNAMKHLLDSLATDISGIPDPRTGANSHYSPNDIVMSAFSCFFSQEKSFLEFQRRMEEEYQVSNLKNLFGVVNIPSDDQIRNFIDLISPYNFNNTFFKILTELKKNNALDEFYVLNKSCIAVALDGSQYFSSQKIHCDNCIVKEHSNGNIEYTHNILGASIVSYNSQNVIPLPPEHNRKDDTNKKQDCEQRAIIRWFERNFPEMDMIIGSENLIFLADDLHSHDPIVTYLNQKETKFILNCKEKSHKMLLEFTKYNTPEIIEYEKIIKGFKEPKLHTIKWINNLPLRDNGETNRVNWFSLTIQEAKITKKEIIDVENLNKKAKKKKKFLNVNADLEFSFITNIDITIDNIVELTDIGRARWKIENNNFHTLKHGGYNIEHNYGHGKNYLSSTLITLIILAFLFHNAIYLLDDRWKLAFDSTKSRTYFFKKLNFLLITSCYYTFDQLLNSLGMSTPPPDVLVANNQLINEQKMIIKQLQDKIAYLDKSQSNKN
jgi:hypothetical protein